VQKILAALASEIADLVIRLGTAQAENEALKQRIAELEAQAPAKG
jgi:BMFP domain-containing protein YqiC